MKKITLLLLLISTCIMHAQFTGPGTYKFKHAVTGKYITVDVANTNCISKDEISPDDATQIFNVVAVPGTSFYNISCTVSEFDALRANGTNILPTSTSTPTSATNNTRIFDILSDGNGAYDVYTPQTSSTRYMFDDSFDNTPSDPTPPPYDDGDVRYTGSSFTKTKWLLEAATILSSSDFDKNSVFVSNPVNGELIIKGLNSNVEQIEVYSLLGKLIIQYKARDNSASIDVSALSSGIYVVKISGDNSSFSKKIVKQ